MTTIAEKLIKISNIKSEIRSAANGKGAAIFSSTPFEAYPSKIQDIPNSDFHQYSTEEHIVGMWIDAPVYEVSGHYDVGALIGDSEYHTVNTPISFPSGAIILDISGMIHLHHAVGTPTDMYLLSGEYTTAHNKEWYVSVRVQDDTLVFWYKWSANAVCDFYYTIRYMTNSINS